MIAIIWGTNAIEDSLHNNVFSCNLKQTLLCMCGDLSTKTIQVDVPVNLFFFATGEKQEQVVLFQIK